MLIRFHRLQLSQPLLSSLEQRQRSRHNPNLSTTHSNLWPPVRLTDRKLSFPCPSCTRRETLRPVIQLRKFPLARRHLARGCRRRQAKTKHRRFGALPREEEAARAGAGENGQGDDRSCGEAGAAHRRSRDGEPLAAEPGRREGREGRRGCAGTATENRRRRGEENSGGRWAQGRDEGEYLTVKFMTDEAMFVAAGCCRLARLGGCFDSIFVAHFA